jgi:Chloroplast envelope transporter
MLQVIEELEKVLAFNDLLTELSKHPEASQFAPGVGPVSLIGRLGCGSSIIFLMKCNLYSHL